MRDLLFNDFWWKLFSLVLAAFIWFTVDKLIEEPQPIESPDALVAKTFDDLPVLIVATAADMHLYHVKPDKVSVTVSGPPKVMTALMPGQIRATVDLSVLGDSAGSLPVNVSVPSGVTFLSVTPVTVNVIVPPKP
jgi:YbbR domain-containing protein